MIHAWYERQATRKNSREPLNWLAQSTDLLPVIPVKLKFKRSLMSAHIPIKLHAFLTAAQTVFARHSPNEMTVNQEFNRILDKLRKAPALHGMFQASHHAIIEHIGVALQHEPKLTKSLLETITPIAQFLPWRHADGDSGALSRSSRRAAMADIIGPLAPFRSTIVNLGLTLIAPNTLCPSHHHSDAELSHVVTGSATWVINGRPLRCQAGTFIATPSQAVHAAHTEHEPLLAIYMRAIQPSVEL
jgi:quercetin dioxygenase-like cupin family protein